MSPLEIQNAFGFLVAPESKLNASLISGHQVIGVLLLAGAINPRLLAEPNPTGSSVTLLIPELKSQKVGAEWIDTTRDLADMNVPQDFPINLMYVVDEDTPAGTPPAGRNVAQALAWLNGKDPVFGIQEFLDASPFLSAAQKNAAAVALKLPGVAPTIKPGLSALAKPR